MVGERVVIILMIAAREIFVDEYFKGVIVPVLPQWVAVTVKEDVVGNFTEFPKFDISIWFTFLCFIN